MSINFIMILLLGDMSGDNTQFVAMEQLVVRLRREIANTKNQVTAAYKANDSLQRELNAATLKITTLTGNS